MKRRVLITGGTGFVGSHAVEAYLAAGWNVRTLVRNPNRLTWLQDLAVETAVGTFADSSSLAAAVKACDVVVHCAAVTKTAQREEYYQINAVAVEALANAAREAGVKRFVLCSTHAAGGPAADGIASREEDAPHPITDYGISKLEGEQRLQQAAADMPWIILRPPSIMGPRDEQFVSLFRGVARYGIYPCLGSGEQRYSYIYVRDFTRALLLAGEAESGLNALYYVASDDVLDWQKAAQTIATFVGRTARAVKIPSFLAKGVGRVNDALAMLTGHAALLSSDKVREMLAQGWVCSPEKIRRTWDFTCEYSTEQALRETYEFYRQTNRL